MPAVTTGEANAGQSGGGVRPPVDTAAGPSADTKEETTVDDHVKPDREDLWRRIQLARACLQHGRTDPLLLLAILDGTSITTLMRREL